MEHHKFEAENSQRPLRLLSLDGGGIRGLSSLYILKSIMAAVQSKSPHAGRVPLRPCDHFDLIGGTSTGGLIAVMLGVLRMDIDSCIKAYQDMAPHIFPVESMLAGSKLGRLTKYITKAQRFSPVPLENAIKRLVVDQLKERATDGENTPINFEVAHPGSYRPCKVFVCVTSEMPRGHFRFRSYDSWSVQDDCSIWEACRATSAAPTFFPPMNIGTPPTPYVDGGLGYNNPIRALMDEVMHLWPDKSIGCIVSIGTGMGLSKDVGSSIGPLLETLKEISTDTENVAREFNEEMAHRYPKRKTYFRFNVYRGLEQVSLEEWKAMSRIKIATRDYLNEQWHQVMDCASQLCPSIENDQTTESVPFAERNVDHVIQLRTERIKSPKACWSVPFERNQRFVGRASQLDELHAKLFATGQCTTLALIGLGGVGKTQIALELAYRTREKYAECSIFWIPATNNESLQQAYLELGRQLQIPDVEVEQADIKKLVQFHLSQENVNQWLLIFDNADDIDMWIKTTGKATELPSSLIDCLPNHSKGSILFTSRSRKVAVKLAQQNVIKVTEMDEDVAMQVLGKSLIDKEIMNDRQTTLNLLKQLTFLPLAIAQAAAYINENEISLSEYVLLLEDKEQNVIELLAVDFEERGRYRNTKNPVATTWLISFEQIRCHDPLAADYLSFMSCLHPRAIPQSLLPLSKSKKQMIDAIGTLSAYSFITKRSGDHQALDLHRLVHLATRNWLHTKNVLDVWTAKTIARLGEAFPTDNHQNRAIWRAHLPHAYYILESKLVEDDTESRVQLLEKIGLCLLSDGRYDEAENPFTQVMKRRKRVLGQDHHLTLTSMTKLALTYRMQGRWKEAEELELQVMETRMTAQGQEHPDTLSSMANLASTYRVQGRWKEAEELEAQVMETRKGTLEQEHPDTLSSMANLAATYRVQGRWKEAEGLEVQVMETRKKALGQEHPDTLSGMANLALTYRVQGWWKEIEGLVLQVMETSSRVLGQEHPDTLISIAALAMTFLDQGRWKEAEELFVQVMETTKRLLGQQHPLTLSFTVNLASTYRIQGRWKDAEGLAVQVIKTRKTLLGREHPSMLSSMTNLALTYLNQGQWNEAEGLFVQVMETSSRMLGQKHIVTLDSMANLATTYRIQGRWREAKRLEVQVLETKKRVLRLDHPSTLNSMANLASTFWNQGRWKKAEVLEVQVLEIRKRVLGKNHSLTLQSMADLASTFWSQRRWKEAEELELQVMNTNSRVLGQEHPDTLTTMANIASTFWNQGRRNEAEELEVQVLETRKRVLGQDHPDTLKIMSNLALTWRSLDHNDQAFELMEECFERRKVKIGSNHPDTINSLKALEKWRKETSSERREEDTGRINGLKRKRTTPILTLEGDEENGRIGLSKKKSTTAGSITSQ